MLSGGRTATTRGAPTLAVLAALPLAATSLVALLDDGGMTAAGAGLVGIGAAASGAILTVLVLAGILAAPVPTRTAASGIIALVGYGALAIASEAWSLSPFLSRREGLIALTYAACAIVGVTIAANAGDADWLATIGLGSLSAAVCVFAVVDRAFSSGRFGLTPRLAGPFDLPNGLALVAACGVVVGVALSIRRGARFAIVGGALAGLTGFTLLLAGSRSGLGLAALALAALVATSDREPVLRLVGPAAVAIGGGVGVGAGRLGAFNRPGPQIDGAGGWLVVLAALAIALGATTVVVGPLLLHRVSRTTDRTVVTALIAVAVVAAIIAAIRVVTSDEQGGTLGDQQGSGRLVSGSLNRRGDWWSSATATFMAAPWRGFGAGTFRITDAVTHADARPEVASPHDIVLQALAGTGIVGGALISVAGLALIAGGALRTLTVARVPTAAAWLAGSVTLAQALIDLSFDITAWGAPAMVGLGVLGAAGGTRSRWSRLPAAVGLAGLAALAIGVSGPWRAARALDGVDGADPKTTIAAANRALDADRRYVPALVARAAGEAAAGDRAAAERTLRDALAIEPANYAAYLTLGDLQAAAGDRAAARASYERAARYSAWRPAAVAALRSVAE